MSWNRVPLTPPHYVEQLADAISLHARQANQVERVAGGTVVNLNLYWGFVSDDVVLAGYGTASGATLEPWVAEVRKDVQDIRLWANRSAHNEHLRGLPKVWIAFAARRGPHPDSAVILRADSGDWEAILASAHAREE